MSRRSRGETPRPLAHGPTEGQDVDQARGPRCAGQHELSHPPALAAKLVVNLKTARALRIGIPQSILLRADRIIN